jgi:hypothetical protein
MTGPFKPLLVSLLLLPACRYHRAPEGLPPPAQEELTWESFFREPWPDPLHRKYEDLFDKPFPNPTRQHFSTSLPMADVTKYELEFEGTAVPGARVKRESGAGWHALALELPDSSDKEVSVRADDKAVRLRVGRPTAPRRYRFFRSDDLILPLPPGADPATARMERDGDRVRITFLARKP